MNTRYGSVIDIFNRAHLNGFSQAINKYISLGTLDNYFGAHFEGRQDLWTCSRISCRNLAKFWKQNIMAGKITLVVYLIFCCQISCVTAASECTGAILASVFGTIGTLLVIAAIAALVWYCCRKKSGKEISFLKLSASKGWRKLCHSFNYCLKGHCSYCSASFVFCRDVVVRVFCRLC